MPRKRAAGTGSIFQRANGTWRTQVTIQGKRISHVARTQKAAAEWARKTVEQIDQGLTFGSTQKDLGTFINEWLEIKRTEVRILTMESYSRLVRLYIIPYLGSVLLKDITAAKIQAFYGLLQGKNAGNRNIKLCHILLYGCLKHGRNLGLVSQNWAELVKAPKQPKHEMSIWSEDQVSSFLAEYLDRTFFRLAFATGMRRGELIGLQWSDVDWLSETIRVRRQVIEPAGGGYLFQEPKTDRGRRSIRLGPGLIQALRSQFNQVLPLARAIAGDRWEEHDLIFPSSIGTPRNGYAVTKEFKRLAKEAGLPAIRLHDIRHTAASIMLLHGEPAVRVAGILGQSVAVLLETYAHYIPDDQERAATLMDTITTPIPVYFNKNS
jgi:integrase